MVLENEFSADLYLGTADMDQKQSWTKKNVYIIRTFCDEENTDWLYDSRVFTVFAVCAELDRSTNNLIKLGKLHGVFALIISI